MYFYYLIYVKGRLKAHGTYEELINQLDNVLVDESDKQSCLNQLNSTVEQRQEFDKLPEEVRRVLYIRPNA